MAALRKGKLRGLPAAVASMRHRLFAAADGEGPIVFGPWLSEVGYELLYWIPFLHWAVKEYALDPERVTIVSRGGVSKWYGGLGKSYADIFDLMPPEEFRRLNEERQSASGKQKHTFFSEFDKQVLGSLNLSGGTLVHPDMMYGLMEDYWSGAAGFSRYSDHIHYKRMKPPAHGIVESLPENFTAVKFYSRLSLPMTDETRKEVERFTLALAEQGPVVVMNTGLAADDHGDFPPPRHPNVSSIIDWVTPSNNLIAQSAVVARAREVFCTYGGFAYLPLFYGVPAFGFYSVDKHFMKIHGRAAYWLSTKMKTPLSVTHISAMARYGGLLDHIDRGKFELNAAYAELSSKRHAAEKYEREAKDYRRLHSEAVESCERVKAASDSRMKKLEQRLGKAEAMAASLSEKSDRYRKAAEEEKERAARVSEKFESQLANGTAKLAALAADNKDLHALLAKEKEQSARVNEKFVNAETKLRSLAVDAVSGESGKRRPQEPATRFDPFLHLIEKGGGERPFDAAPPPDDAVCKRFGSIHIAFPDAPDGADWIVDKLKASAHLPIKAIQLQLLALKLPRRNGVIIDIGANLGLTVLPPLLLGLVSRAIAVEPSRRNFDFLAWNVEANGLSDQVALHRAALADKPGEDVLAVTAATGLHHLQSRDVVDEIAQEKIPVTTLDRLIAEAGAAADALFIKCDTQGAEARILAGAGETLARRSAIWEIEFWPHGIRLLDGDPDFVLSVLEKSFSCFLDEKAPGEGLRPIAELRYAEARLTGIQHTDLFLVP